MVVGLPAHSISYYEPGPKFATCSALSPSQNMAVFGVGRDLKTWKCSWKNKTFFYISNLIFNIVLKLLIWNHVYFFKSSLTFKHNYTETHTKRNFPFCGPHVKSDQVLLVALKRRGAGQNYNLFGWNQIKPSSH